MSWIKLTTTHLNDDGLETHVFIVIQPELANYMHISALNR
jgi:hypothetical protein